MSQEFHRDYLVRLPLPLAQLYGRAYNAKDARSRHDNTFYLWEALIKLTAAPAIACYLREVRQGTPRVPALDRLLAQLALPSLGQWTAMLRELARHFGQRADAATCPLGNLWQQLSTKRRDLPAVLALFQRIKNGADGDPVGDQSCTLLEVIEALVVYRNSVFGHGAGRFQSFYEQEMGPLLFPAANEVLADGVLNLLGPPGARLVYLTELRTLDERRVEVGLLELVGREPERAAPLELSPTEAAGLTPNCVAVVWPGTKAPLRLDPLLVFRGSELAEEVLFLNRDRNGRQAEYLSYTTGRTERDKAMGPALANLLSQIAGREVGEAELERLSQQSLAETPSVEALFTTDLPTARVLGDYEILAELGRGGMGVVYLARQLSLGRLVALKMLPTDLAGDDVALARFRREIRHLARCEHPNIIKVLASGAMPDGQLYYSMEYMAGSDLELVWRELSGSHRKADTSTLGNSTWAQAVLSASHKRREQAAGRNKPKPTDAADSKLPLAQAGTVPAATDPDTANPKTFTPSPPHPVTPSPPHLLTPSSPNAADDPGGFVRRVAGLVRDAALAVQAVHDQGIVHRDVKPANLMLSPDGTRLVLMDFGLAKGQTHSLSISRSGGFLGTLRYAAPEQLAAALLKVGPQADVRALGATLWELLTRERLFGDAEDEAQLAGRVMTDEVPRLRSLDPGFDRDLDAIVARATERNVADRIATAGQLAEYLQLYLDGRPLPIRPPSARELVLRWVAAHKPLVASVTAASLAILLTIAIAFASINNALQRESQALIKEKGALGKESAALAETKIALRDLESAKQGLEQEQTRLRQSLSLQCLHRGVFECERGQLDLGLSLLLQAYQTAPDKDPLRTSARSLLGSWLTELEVRVRDDDSISLSGFYAVAYSPDGRTVLTASDKTARFWDASSGAPRGVPLQHDGIVNAVAFSPDGRTVLTGCGDKTARFWDASSGAPKGEPLRHEDSVRAVAFSPDGQTVVTGSQGKPGRFWDVSSGAPKGPLLRDWGVHSLAFSPDGRSVITARWDTAAVMLWDVSSGDGKPIREAGVRAVAFSPDGRTVLTGSENKTARFWDAASGAPKGEILRHEDGVMAVAYSPDGQTVLTGCRDTTARFWDATSGAPLGEPLRHGGSVLALGFSPDGQAVATGSSDDTACFWNASRRGPQGDRLRHKNGVNAVAFSPDGRTVLTGSKDFTARFWDATSGAPKGKPLVHSANVSAVAFSRDGQTVCTGCWDSTARLWDAASGEPKGLPLRHQFGAVCAVALSPDGQTVLTGGFGLTARFWDASSGASKGEPLQHKAFIVAVAYSPDGQTVCTGSFDNTAMLWDATSGAPKGKPLQHEYAVCAVAFSPDGRTVLTGSYDKTAHLWDASSGDPKGELLRHEGIVDAVAFSPDGRTVLTGSRDGTAHFWDAHTGVPKGKLLRHDPPVSAVQAPIVPHTPVGDDTRVAAVAFSPDGKSACTGSWDTTARFWRVPAALADEPQRLRRTIEVRTNLGYEDNGARRTLSQAERDERWRELERLGGAIEPFSAEHIEHATRRYHYARAREFEESGRWFAASFHLNRLLLRLPGDPDLLDRRQRALAHLESPPTAPSPTEPDK